MSSSATGRLQQGPVPFRIVDSLRPFKSSTYSVQALFEWIKDKSLDLNPEYQRDVVWTLSKQANLIDSLFRNFHIPPLIFAMVQDTEGFTKRVCIDGKQRLTSIMNFMEGKISQPNPANPRDKYWYSYTDQAGYILPKPFRDQFAKKQIVCIEYETLDDNKQREIFRRVQLGVALNVSEKMKAESYNPKLALIKRLADKHKDTLKKVNFTAQRDAAFRWIAAALFSIHEFDVSEGFVHSTYKALQNWLGDNSNATSLTPRFVEQFEESFELLINIITTKRQALRVTKAPWTIAPVDLVAMIYLVYHFKHRFEDNDIANAIQAMRNAARVDHDDLLWNRFCVEPYSNFIKGLRDGGLNYVRDIGYESAGEDEGEIDELREDAESEDTQEDESQSASPVSPIAKSRPRKVTALASTAHSVSPTKSSGSRPADPSTSKSGKRGRRPPGVRLPLDAMSLDDPPAQNGATRPPASKNSSVGTDAPGAKRPVSSQANSSRKRSRMG